MLMRLGDIEIWRVLEWVGPFISPFKFYPDLDEAGLDEIKRHAPRQLDAETGKIVLPVQGFLIRDGVNTVLVDSCVGNHKTVDWFPDWHQKTDSRFMASLTAAGAAPEDVTHVLCTHLHVDHTGWNTRLLDGRWVPSFPNARYLVSQADLDLFGGENTQTYQDNVAPIVAAGLAEIVGPDHGIGDHIRLIPTPGHTPGHVSVKVSGGGRDLILTGDALHSPVQCRHPEWRFASDEDAGLAVESRKKLLGNAAETQASVIGSHFPLPSVGTVRAEGDHFAWDDGN